MALTGALVDKARRISEQGSAGAEPGLQAFSRVEGEWFKARVQIEDSTEAVDQVGGVRTVTEQPLLLYGVKDLAGQPVVLTGEDRVEVLSNVLGADPVEYDVIADPTPLRKKRRVIGFQVALRRVTIHGAP